ncbi:hypothetical protein PL335_06505 [Sulfitobacter faviae]|uniref:hypothetical protein n=1 Tax=Sulfitobacter faviae TaxID=1775881 RepID=UPI00230815C9|nr:hypothetical protein [Sulfitobacter faviae]WCE67993.1 hypothetical protein PL335_06505 [Sulfitobacter faviae]
MMDFFANLFSLGSISTSRHGLSILLGVMAAAFTAWGWGADSGWFVFFGQVALVLACAAEGYGAVSAGAAGIIALVYFSQSILFVEANRKADELDKIYENCVPNAQGELSELCPFSGKED